MTARELERYLIDFSKDLRYVTATKLPVYFGIMNAMAEQRPHPGRGIGYCKEIGWFVLQQPATSDSEPLLVWSEKGGDEGLELYRAGGIGE